MKQIGYKYCDLELKDLDKKAGIVSFYFAPFNIIDGDGDETSPSAFDKTFSESKSRVKHFRNHDKKEVPGTIIELGKDNKGAWATSQLAIKTIVGLDTFEQYQSGIITEHSYGFEKIKFEQKADGGKILKENKLWEVSSLTHWGASQHTPVRSIKSLEECADYLSKVNELLTKGDISDALGERIEKEYKSLCEIVEKMKAEKIKLTEPKGIDFDFLVKNF